MRSAALAWLVLPCAAVLPPAEQLFTRSPLSRACVGRRDALGAARTALASVAAAGAALQGARRCGADDGEDELARLKRQIQQLELERSKAAPAVELEAPAVVEVAELPPAQLELERSKAAPAVELEAPAVVEVAELPPAPAPPPRPTGPTASDFKVPFRGEPEKITPFLGKATLIVNVKLDDPETNEQLPALQGMVDKYSKQGLSVLAFPTDQVSGRAKRRTSERGCSNERARL